MRGKVAKRIRRQVYGAGHHMGPVLYYRDKYGTTTSDTQRQLYQMAKRQIAKRSNYED